ncbi:hypothetical protein NDR89_20150 [Cupriavidus gilardii]|uniref:ASCH domain-containing protein n=1 Tax=Cupriavidus gilardii TaxID=82541 RepID=A0ABY4VT34_9BURK|nr:hypothetical protein [Cupriavidus gilardii]USE78951.1 hypothetical protein NDR89_20150 [Cupriavidus gilardii]
MKERPILFSGAMVRAIFDGRKTQTRRVAKEFAGRDDLDAILRRFPHQDGCPYGRPGDRLWVRETWQHENYPLGPYEPDCTVFYRADYLDDPLGPDLERSVDGIRRRWNPSIHMPRTACRLVLEVTGVRVERLQDISYEDAIAEGMFDPGTIESTYPLTGETGEQLGRRLSHPQRSFAILWEELNGPGAWDANPWVWVVEFRRV